MITLLTDFGTSDHYTGVLKGVIKGINPDIDIVDISHDVSNHSIENAQFFLFASYKHFPAGTIFCIVIDPGVGTSRKTIAVSDGTYYFILPDNGIISAIDNGQLDVYEIDISEYKIISRTFHGRDIFAPCAAKLSINERLDKIGIKTAEYISVPFPENIIDSKNILGSILHIDKFGNAITSIPSDMKIIKSKNSFDVSINGMNYKGEKFITYKDIDSSFLPLIEGSSSFIEIALNQESASEKYNLKTGDKINFNYA